MYNHHSRQARMYQSAQELANQKKGPIYICESRFVEEDGPSPLILFDNELNPTDRVIIGFLPQD